MINNLWVEKYRPKTLDEYVFKDENLKKTVQRWIKDGDIPHILLKGGAGTGKTSLAKVLVNELGIDESDVKLINASRENGVDEVRDSITRFASTIAFSGYKIIILDEAEYLSPNAQAAMRGTIEEFSHVVRFILTCNNPERLLPAIHSRMQTFHITNHDEADFTVRIAEILADENIEMDETTLETIDTYVKATYPDMRKTINEVQKNCATGKLLPPDEVDDASADWKFKMVELFKAGKLRDARTHICNHASLGDYDDIYRYMYRNLNIFGDTDAKQDEAVIIIRDAMVKHIQVADPEINLSACMVELMRIE